MAYNGNCAHCGSFHMQALGDLFQCLKCGLTTSHTGEAVAAPPPQKVTTWPGRANIDGPSSEGI